MVTTTGLQIYCSPGTSSLSVFAAERITRGGSWPRSLPYIGRFPDREHVGTRPAGFSAGFLMCPGVGGIAWQGSHKLDGEESAYE